MCVKEHDFWKSYVLRVVLPSCDVCFRILCLKDRLNCACLGVQSLPHYLFRVSNPAAILV